MYKQQTLQQLCALKLTGMADALNQQLEQPNTYEEVPDWGKANYDLLREAMVAVDWETEFENKSGYDCMTVFQEVLDREVEKFLKR